MLKTKYFFILAGFVVLSTNAFADEPSDTLSVEAKNDSTLIKEVFEAPVFENIYFDTLSVENIHAVPDSIIRRRLEILDSQSPFDFVYNSLVRQYINMYLDKRTDLVERMAGLSYYYYPLFDEILERYEVPLEIKNLVVIESAMNPKARARSGEAGLWQFMLGTGKVYDLNVENYIDERCNPRLATEAAARFLKDLYNEFGDWNLALAAYNCGPGNVKKAIARSGHKDYWAIRPWLPSVTQTYIAAFIAANYVMEYYPLHGITPIAPSFIHGQTDTVQVKKMMDFNYIAKNIGVSVEELQFLNPDYRLDLVPCVEGKKYYLVLPEDKAVAFAQAETRMYEEVQAREDSLKKKIASAPYYASTSAKTIKHVVRKGETLGGIALKYRVSVSQIKSWNHLKSSMIRIGQSLMIYKK